MGNVAAGDAPINQIVLDNVERTHHVILHYMRAIYDKEVGVSETIDFRCSTTQVRHNLLELIEAKLREEGKSLDVDYILHNVVAGYFNDQPVYDNVFGAKPNIAVVSRYNLTGKTRIVFTVAEVDHSDPAEKRRRVEELYRGAIADNRATLETSEALRSYVVATKRYLKGDNPGPP